MSTIANQIKVLSTRFSKYTELLGLLNPHDKDDKGIIALINYKQEEVVDKMMSLQKKLKAEKLGLKLVVSNSTFKVVDNNSTERF